MLSRCARSIAAFSLLFLLAAAPAQKGFIEGKVEPAGVNAMVVARPARQVARGPLASVLTAADTTTDKDGRYRLEVDPGSYTVMAYAPAYVYAGENPSGASVMVKAGDTARGPDFSLVEAAEIRGLVRGSEGLGVVAAIRRSPLPREQRFQAWTRVGVDTGQYRIKDLRPGIYDLTFVSPTTGIIDCRGYLLGERGTLSQADRAAIEQANSAYVKAWAKSKPTEALTVISTSYADPQGGTHEKLKEQYGVAEQRKDMGWQIVRLNWKILLIQGTQSEAMAVVHQEQQQKVGRSKKPLAVSDLLVHYVKEGGAWKISGIELIREYALLESKISQLVGVRCDLPEKYVVKYVGDPVLGSIMIRPGDVSSGHDFDLRSLLK